MLLLIATLILLVSNAVYYAVKIREDFVRRRYPEAVVGLVTVVGLYLILGIVYFVSFRL